MGKGGGPELGGMGRRLPPLGTFQDASCRFSEAVEQLACWSVAGSNSGA